MKALIAVVLAMAGTQSIRVDHKGIMDDWTDVYDPRSFSFLKE